MECIGGKTLGSLGAALNTVLGRAFKQDRWRYSQRAPLFSVLTTSRGIYEPYELRRSSCTPFNLLVTSFY